MPLDAAAWSTALPDWEARIVEGRSLIPDLPLFDAYAERALSIFKRLKVPDLIGTPTFGDVCEPWVFDFVRALFGSYDPVLRQRMIQEYFLLVPKKNGKSAIAAAIMVTAMLLNERPMAEMLLISETQTIAGITFRTARGIIQLDPDLNDLFHIRDHMKVIVRHRTGAELKIVSADGDVVTGSKAAAVLVDESHVMGMKRGAAGIYLELRGGLASRPEGFFLQISTQSKVPPAGQFRHELNRARAVRDGRSDARLLAVLYELPEDMARSQAWRDEATWGLVNPNLERSVSREFLREQYQNAIEDGPAALALFASQHLNVEIGLGLHDERWPGADHWEGCAEAGLTLEGLLARAEVCAIGVDWGGADDLASLAVMGRCATTKSWLHWSKSWARPSVFEQRKSIAPQLRDFERDGDLEIVETGEEQARRAAAVCAQVFESGLLPEEGGIGLDVAGVALLLDELEARGMVAPLVVSIPQGWKLQTAVSSLPLKLEARRMVHAGQPIMTWAVGNAKQVLRGSNYVVTKEAAGAAKIDPLAATFNAAMILFGNPVAAGAMKYEYTGM